MVRTASLLALLAACSTEPQVDALPTDLAAIPATMSLDLTRQPMLVGDTVTFDITGGPPNSLLYLLVTDGPQGNGPCPQFLGGDCFDLIPGTFASKSTLGRTDATGQLVRSLTVPGVPSGHYNAQIVARLGPGAFVSTPAFYLSVYDQVDCYDFTNADWTYHLANTGGTPTASNGPEVQLIADDVLSAGAAVVSTHPLLPPFAITLEYRTFDDDGGPFSLFNSADGIAVFGQKDGGAYGSPPPGGAVGFIPDNSGYAVKLATYGNRRAVFLDGSGAEVQPTYADVYTHDAWLPLTVEFGFRAVSYDWNDGEVTDSWLTGVSLVHDAWGITAGSGGADADHSIRNVCAWR